MSEDILLNIEKVHDLIVSVVIARERWHGDGALHVIAGRHAGPLVWKCTPVENATWVFNQDESRAHVEILFKLSNVDSYFAGFSFGFYSQPEELLILKVLWVTDAILPITV